jgi:hypothetical protein
MNRKGVDVLSTAGAPKFVEQPPRFAFPAKRLRDVKIVSTIALQVSESRPARAAFLWWRVHALPNEFSLFPARARCSLSNFELSYRRMLGTENNRLPRFSPSSASEMLLIRPSLAK